MDKRSKLILFTIGFFTVISTVLSCERDDICTGESITPLLIIDFVDVEDTDDLDDVNDLQIMYIGDPLNDEDNDRFVFDDAFTATTVSLPLPTFKNEATFVFFQDFDEDDNQIETERDTITFNYFRVNEFINRACGNRTIYTDLRIDLREGAPSFIQGVLQNQITVEDEEETHVSLLH